MTRRLHRFVLVESFALLFACCSIATAARVPGGAVTGGLPSINFQTQTIGWEFRPTTPITLVALGLFDEGGDGLADPHPVALWKADGTPLAQATVGPGVGAALVGAFRYVEISPVVLSPLESYVLGGLYLGTRDGGSLDPTPETRDSYHSIQGNRSFTPEVEFLSSRSSGQQGTGISFPSQASAAFAAEMGPNFLFEVPEPAAMAIAFSLCCVASRRARIA